MIKKNNQGFTLVELLVVIAILGLLVLATAAGTSRATEIARERAYETLLAEIKSSAERYAGITNVRALFVRELVEEGYVTADARGFVNDPRTNESLNCYQIHLEFEGGVFKASIIRPEEIGADRNRCDDRPLPRTFMTVTGSGQFRTISVSCRANDNIIIASNRGWQRHGVCQNGAFSVPNAPFSLSPTTYTATIRGADQVIRSNSCVIDATTTPPRLSC